MNIVTRPIDSVRPYERNPRNNDKAVEAVARSIKEFGFKVPIVVDKDGIVVAGHTRLKAAKQLGLTEVPCIVADDLTPEQIKAFRIADNKTSELAEWNMELLPLELRELADAGFDMDTLAFDTAELEMLLNGGDVTPGQTEPDAVPEPPEEPKSVPGEIYILGGHRLMCGDSTSADDMAKLMNGEQAELYLTDPPYNVKLEGSNGLTIKNDNMDSESFLSFLRNAFKPAGDALCPGGVFYIYHGDSEAVNFRLAAASAGLVVHSTLYWVKDSFNLNFADYHPKTEAILYGWKEGAPHAWYSDRAQSNVLEFRRPLINDVHPCLSPDTQVLTANGYVPVDGIRIGDEVLSADGMFHKVEMVTRHDCHENIYEIRVSGTNLVDRATGNHRYLTVKNDGNGALTVDWADASELAEGDMLLTPESKSKAAVYFAGDEFVDGFKIMHEGTVFKARIIDSIISVPYDGEVVNLGVEGSPTFLSGTGMTHNSMKPVDMLVYLVKNSSKTGGIVLDNFGGSGSTLIACEQTGRKCRAMELDPKYCDVIRKRWAEFVNGEGCDWESLTPVFSSEEGVAG